MNYTRSQPLTTIESLLLAQAVWEYGAAQSSWSEIAKILSRHPLLSRPKSFFNPQSCHSMYELLLKDADLEPNDLNNAAHAPMNLQLAQKHYQSRFLELRDLIMAEESKFKTILREIEELKNLRGEALNQRQEEEEEESRRDAEGKEEEEEDDKMEEEEANKEGEGQEEEIKPLEEKGDQEEMESNAIAEEGEGEESKEEENEANPVAEDNSQERVEESEGEEGEEEETEANPVAVENSQEEVEEGGGEEEKEEEPEANPVTVDNSQESHGSPQEQDKTDEDHEQDDQTNLENNAELDMGSESEVAATPAEIPASPSSINPAEVVDDEHTSGDEHVMFTRRSSRRRKSSATSLPPPPARKQLRSRGRISELEPQQTVDSENESENRDDYPQVDDDQLSSPFDGSMARRRDGKRKASFVESAESPSDKKRMREDSEPAEEEDPGPSSHTRTRATRHTMRTEEQVALKRFQNVIGMLHSQISQHRNGNIFHNPIKNSEAPDYREIVKRPMDLKTIKTRVKDGVIANSLEFQRDIFLMFANAMMYNRPGSDVHAMAEDMMLESEGQILAFRQTEGLVKRGQRP